jgi:hypothetical protein
MYLIANFNNDYRLIKFQATVSFLSEKIWFFFILPVK